MNRSIQSTPITFAQIFNTDFDGKHIGLIEIPIIQRDYAQGRKTDRATRIREQFLSVLYKALTGDASIKLDFVYGDIVQITEKEKIGGNVGEAIFKMIPLDGQQRLTTLFLLHWYIARHEHVEECGFLRSFTYKTRFSSNDFCEFLTSKFMPNFSLPTISEYVKDAAEFREAWNNDPTIISMLEMLDAIHERFKGTSGLWAKLTASETPAISFYFLPIVDMGLTDSLYIKMNSRGKSLTDFEHFKAAFEKIIKVVSEDKYKKFSRDIDIKWTNMLWPYRGDNNIIDDEFLRYYRFVTEMICYKNGHDIETNDIDLAEAVYGIGNDRAEENLEFLFAALDCWCDIDIYGFFDELFSKNEFISGKVKVYGEFGGSTNIFWQCCDRYESRRKQDPKRQRYFSYSKSLLLYAVLTYILNRSNEAAAQNIAERMRIVRNLIWHSGDEIREERMQILLQETRNIILEGKLDTEIVGYNKLQKQEELDKIAWRSRNSEDAIDELHHLEDHFLLQGTVRIIDLDSADFKKRSKTFRALFNPRAYDTNSIDYITISRALVATGNFYQYSSWRTFLGGVNNSSWREMFVYSSARNNFDTAKDCLERLLDKIDINENIPAQLECIIEDFVSSENTPKEWRYYLAKYPTMRSGASGVYWWRNGSKQYDIVMMNTAHSLNGYHWQPFLRQLHKDHDLRGMVSLENYGNPLVFNNGDELACRENRWKITPANGDEPIYIDIPQTDGIDNEDRIVKIKDYIIEHYANKN